MPRLPIFILPTKRDLIFLFCLCFLPAVAMSQSFGSIEANQVKGMFVNWSSGGLTLESGETIDCDVRLDQLKQQIGFRYNGITLDVPIESISAFHLYDSISESVRFFRRLVVKSGKNIIVEILYESDNAFLLEEKFIRSFHMAYPTANLERADFYYRTPVAKIFLLRKSTEEFKSVTEENILSLFKDKKHELQTFMNRKKINVTVVEDCIKVLEYYDSL